MSTAIEKLKKKNSALEMQGEPAPPQILRSLLLKWGGTRTELWPSPVV